MPCYTIVGAGPVGTLMALMLARAGARVRLLERRPDPRRSASERGRSINLALAARGLQALQQAALMPLVSPQMISMPGRMLHDLDGGLQFLRYGKNEREVIHAIDRECLNRVLVEAAAASAGIELRFNLRCLDVDPEARTLQLRAEADGTLSVEPFEVLLAADGAGSAVRAALAARRLTRVQEQPLAHDYKELHLPAHASASPHAGYAFEPHALHIWPRGEHMLIALPNLDRSFTATLFLPRQGPVSFESLQSAEAATAFFQRQFADAWRAIPDLTRQFAQHPQSRLGTLHCERWHASGSVLLLGDAAHAIVPFHGQGLNCGFEDCSVLAALLSAGDAPETAMARFEQQRRPNTEAIAAMALENYLEMRDRVRAPQFAAQQRLAAQLEQHFPGRFIPRYSMVMFHPEISYAEAQRRGTQQQRLLDQIGGSLGYGPLDSAQLSQVGQWLDQAEL